MGRRDSASDSLLVGDVWEEGEAVWEVEDLVIPRW